MLGEAAALAGLVGIVKEVDGFGHCPCMPPGRGGSGLNIRLGFGDWVLARHPLRPPKRPLCGANRGLVHLPSITFHPEGYGWKIDSARRRRTASVLDSRGSSGRRRPPGHDRDHRRWRAGSARRRAALRPADNQHPAQGRAGRLEPLAPGARAAAVYPRALRHGRQRCPASDGGRARECDPVQAVRSRGPQVDDCRPVGEWPERRARGVSREASGGSFPPRCSGSRLGCRGGKGYLSPRSAFLPVAATEKVPMADDYNRKRNTAGGVGVILVTALAALSEASFFDGSPANTFLAVLTFGLALGGAFALWRFVSRHGDQIGEVRFDTRNKDEQQP